MQKTVGLKHPVVGLPCYHSDMLSDVIVKQIIYTDTDNSAAGRGREQ